MIGAYDINNMVKASDINLTVRYLDSKYMVEAHDSHVVGAHDCHVVGAHDSHVVGAHDSHVVGAHGSNTLKGSYQNKNMVGTN
jgi:hypothetical protein